ncbi:MAG TPA: ATPase, T2SS/T4P/T4SS family [Vicinamibacterales bacterium]
MSAIVRADGDALVMHVGERPYVVVGTQTITISTHGLNLDAMTNMLAQLLSAEAQTQLEEFGAVEYKVPQQGEDRFSVVAARGGDDIWIEIRRRRPQPAPAVAAPPPVQAPAAVSEPAPAPPPVAAVAEPVADSEPIAEPVPEPVAAAIAAPPSEPPSAPSLEPAWEPPSEPAWEPPVEPSAEPSVEPPSEPSLEPPSEPSWELPSDRSPEPLSEFVPEPSPIPDAITEPVAEPMPVFARDIPAAAITPPPAPPIVPEPLAQDEMAQEPITPEPPAPEPIAPEPIPEPIAAEPEPSVEAPAPVEAPEPVVYAESMHQTAGDSAEQPAAVEQVHEEAQIAALAETLETAAREAEILEQAPRIAALAETLEAARVQEIVEEAPKIAALVETLEAAPAFQQAQEVQEVQRVQTVQEVHQVQGVQAVQTGQTVQTVHTGQEVHAQTHAGHAGGGKPPAPVERAEPIERVEPLEPREPKERVEPREPRERLEPLEHLEPLERLEPPPTVVPMTRTVRIEVPPRTQPPSRAASSIDRLLRVAAARGASALFLTSDSRPWIRVEGDLRFLETEAAWSRADVESAILEIAPESGQESIGRGEATEWLSEFEGVGRIRCTTFHDHRGPGVQLRMIATKAATAEQLGLSREVQALATEAQGIVLVAGPRASGKSTMLSALVDLVNRQRAEYVISLERQIRLVHDNRMALVSQREIRGGAEDAVIAARAALRESPDVLVVDDLMSSHMVPLLLTAASEGLLIFVSITAASTADAVERFVELAPPEMRKAVQNAMAEEFRGAIGQVLLKKSGGGLVAAREVLLATAPVTRVIEEGQLGQLPLTLESGRKHGMMSLTDSLAEFVRAGTVDLREAFRKAPDRTRLLEILKRDGVDTSAVERLA